MHQTLLYVGLFVWTILLYSTIVFATRRSLWFVPVMCGLHASPILIFALGVWLEKRAFTDLINPSHGSWAFLFGDVLLSAALGCAAHGWRTLPKCGWYYKWWWPTVCLGVGMLAGLTFHLVDRSGYIAADIPLALVSPTKVGHDGVAYPTLVAALLFAGLPVLLKKLNGHAVFIAALVIGWLILCICDQLRHLNPTDLHIEWNVEEFKPL